MELCIRLLGVVILISTIVGTRKVLQRTRKIPFLKQGVLTSLNLFPIEEQQPFPSPSLRDRKRTDRIETIVSNATEITEIIRQLTDTHVRRVRDHKME